MARLANDPVEASKITAPPSAMNPAPKKKAPEPRPAAPVAPARPPTAPILVATTRPLTRAEDLKQKPNTSAFPEGALKVRVTKGKAGVVIRGQITSLPTGMVLDVRHYGESEFRSIHSQGVELEAAE